MAPVVDDCWSVKSGRDEKTNKIVPDPKKFPNGISGTADAVHKLGLKFGLYSSAGTETCQEYPASIGLEELDASTFAGWGVDYLKYDNCHVPSDYKDEYNSCEPDHPNTGNYGNYPNGTCPGLSHPAPKGYDWTKSKSFLRYHNMGTALQKQDRVILYSLCNQGHAEVHTWGASMAASWRTENDISPHWYRLAQILNDNSFKLNYVDFGSHNDMDMLEIGNGDLTIEENRSHFALWAAAKSPLIIGTDLAKLAPSHLQILKNKILINFSQDKNHGKPAMPFKWGVNPNWTYDPNHPAEYWSGASSNGTLVLALNTEDKQEVRSVQWKEVPGLKASGYEVQEGWTGKSLGCISGFEATLESHDTAVFLVGASCTHSTGTYKISSSVFN